VRFSRYRAAQTGVRHKNGAGREEGLRRAPISIDLTQIPKIEPQIPPISQILRRLLGNDRMSLFVEATRFAARSLVRATNSDGPLGDRTLPLLPPAETLMHRKMYIWLTLTLYIWLTLT
jgi:hypothetical protein